MSVKIVFTANPKSSKVAAYMREIKPSINSPVSRDHAERVMADMIKIFGEPDVLATVTIEPIAYNPNHIKELQAEWERIAGESLTIEACYVGEPILAFGSELATLRLFRKMPSGRVEYSKNLRSWFFVNKGGSVLFDPKYL